MQKIVPHLWFDTQAKAAAEFYTSVFNNSKIEQTVNLRNTPSGDSNFLTISLEGQDFMLISAGPYFKCNPSVSFMVACKTKDEVNALWSKLSELGKVMMELAEYPFSKWYGWTEDKFGVSWQVMLTDQDVKQKITPTMMFTGDMVGKCEEAVKFYASVFHNSHIGEFSRYGKGQEPDKENYVNHVGFTLEGIDFAAMESARNHNFAFNEAISFLVNCDTQEEIDYYWEKLSVVPAAEQCGWLKDKYGFSWQISPTILSKMLTDTDQAKVDKVTQAFLKMKKMNIAELEAAYQG